MTWQNLISFICAGSNFGLPDTSAPITSLGHIIGFGLLPRIYDEDADIQPIFESFVRQCVELLVCQSPIVRETVKEALGNEMPLCHLPLLIQQMTK